MPEDKGLPKSARAEREEQILAFWKENQIFEKSLKKPGIKGEFVFYEGPPTANGRPGIHHIESRSFKDAIPRFKTMQGFHVPRKAGWDTHGLPVELEVEKKLGLKSKKEIEKYGVEKFNQMCRESVGTYIDEWEKFSERMGYWADLDNAYFTYRNSYIQAVWSIISHVNDRGLLYKDYKVLPWCPRCGTALSSHELAQPGAYQDVKDLSIYAKFKVVGEDNTFILAWTTTPWTLPGNLALAVGEDIDYIKVKSGEEIYVLGETFGDLVENGEVVERLKGKDLVGLSYEPLYPFMRERFPDNDKMFKVYSANFVTTEDGTGIVHTAVMYGQDDFVLGTEVGLPKEHLVSPEATFLKHTGWLEGRSVIDPELAVDILKDLQKRNLVFKKENHLHSYPFCWRCKTRLIYYARDSWYIAMSRLRDGLVKENEKINWEPEYIKEGRFGEWLREVKDWAISRERYWGTPLPVWEAQDKSDRILVDSLDTLKKYIKSSGNKYFVMRHGGTKGNKSEIVSFKHEAKDHLTSAGRDQVALTAQALRDRNINVIVCSPFTRTTETAEIVAETLGIKTLVKDKRFQEVDPGEFDGKNWNEYHQYVYGLGPDWFNHRIPGGESLSEVNKRVAESLYELEEKYQQKNILIITHGGPAWVAFVNSGLHVPEGKEYRNYTTQDTRIFVNDFKRFQNAEVRELPFVPLPHDKEFQLDLHKPFIDDVILVKNGKEYKRVKEVMDVWLDSGAVPFAQESGEREVPTDFSHIVYPADFISEAIDQTRGWFYTLHAVGVLMEKGQAFKNNICLGHILDKEGKKMSKSVGNVVDPWIMMDKFGADTLRLWMYSVNQPGESKNFDERSLDEIQKRVFNLLDNVYAFYEIYRDKSLEVESQVELKNVLDIWILMRMNELVNIMTQRLESFQLLEPVRALRDFIDDLSTWYLRRSRERLKEGDTDAKRTLYYVLKTVSKLFSPFAPFAAEDLYQKLRADADPLSVHLEAWPEGGEVDKSVLEKMKKTREIVSRGLEARSKANIKIRQPLASLTIKLDGAHEDLIKEEVNVKRVVDTDTGEAILNTNLSLELIEEGKVREIIRAIQEMRKEKGLNPKDKIRYKPDPASRELFYKYQDVIAGTTNIEIEWD
ncbi:class I tRNA ligase family protein [Candidatus Parcubacteria bacterium]|nr:class I tRNA ligase family protein [Candidatus Parcubacteria bacterium]